MVQWGAGGKSAGADSGCEASRTKLRPGAAPSRPGAVASKASRGRSWVAVRQWLRKTCLFSSKTHCSPLPWQGSVCSPIWTFLHELRCACHPPRAWLTRSHPRDVQTAGWTELVSPKVLTLEFRPAVLQQGQFCPQGTLAMPEDTLGCHIISGGGARCKHLLGGGWNAAAHHTTGRIQPQTALGSLARTPGLDRRPRARCSALPRKTSSKDLAQLLASFTA